MKSIIKIMSACVLVVATANCSTLDQGQQLMIGIKNNVKSLRVEQVSTDAAKSISIVEVDKPSIFGNVYQTDRNGKVIETDPKHYKIDFGQCLRSDIHKPKSLSGRIMKYHRIIVATSKEALQDKIMNNKNSNEVESRKIEQSSKQKAYAENECYSITQTSGKTKKKLKINPKLICSKDCNIEPKPEAINF